ncbi:MAG: hypothetical protein AAB728_00165 [Patescibacteria group bacterium]
MSRTDELRREVHDVADTLQGEARRALEDYARSQDKEAARGEWPAIVQRICTLRARLRFLMANDDGGFQVWQSLTDRASPAEPAESASAAADLLNGYVVAFEMNAKRFPDRDEREAFIEPLADADAAASEALRRVDILPPRRGAD